MPFEVAAATPEALRPVLDEQEDRLSALLQEETAARATRDAAHAELVRLVGNVSFDIERKSDEPRHQ